MAATQPFTEAEQRAWTGFLAVHSRVTRELDALLGAEHGMPLVEYEVLLKLAIAGGRLRMSELADEAFLSRSGLTRIVDELESLGHVRREPDEQDGRVLIATLTTVGRRRLAAARRSHRAHVRALFLDHLTGAQQATLGEGWERILDGLGEEVGQRPRRRASRQAGARPAGRATRR